MNYSIETSPNIGGSFTDYDFAGNAVNTISVNNTSRRNLVVFNGNIYNYEYGQLYSADLDAENRMNYYKSQWYNNNQYSFDYKLPQIKTNFEMPSINIPNFVYTPQDYSPNVSKPNVDINTPNYNYPNSSSYETPATPQINLPNYTLPDISIETPEITLPTITIPSI